MLKGAFWQSSCLTCNLNAPLLDAAADDAGRNTQLSSLSKELAPRARVEELSFLHWGVVPARGARLVLGDVVVIAKTERRSEYVNLTAADGDFPLVAVVFRR